MNDVMPIWFVVLVVCALFGGLANFCRMLWDLIVDAYYGARTAQRWLRAHWPAKEAADA